MRLVSVCQIGDEKLLKEPLGLMVANVSLHVAIRFASVADTESPPPNDVS